MFLGLVKYGRCCDDVEINDLVVQSLKSTELQKTFFVYVPLFHSRLLLEFFLISNRERVEYCELLKWSLLCGGCLH